MKDEPSTEITLEDNMAYGHTRRFNYMKGDG